MYLTGFPNPLCAKLIAVATQQRVRCAVAQVGGYWRPLAGVARLLEELGELAESLADPALAPGELASELADLWIITTVILDQFLGYAVEPGSQPPHTSAMTPTIGELLAAAGQIARIVNYYDGPKTPRFVERLPSLNDAVVEFQRALAAVAQAHKVDLGLAVGQKLDVITARDIGRFEHREHDPCAARSIERFRLIQTTLLAPRPEHARLWGAPAWSRPCVASNVEAMIPALSSFSRAAVRERLDAFVIAGPPFESMERMSEWLERLLDELIGRDPKRTKLMRGPVSTAGRQLSFDGVPMVVEVFSPLYPPGDPRYSPTDTFAVLSPR
jgi:NTP pyrophosphatase (non-canonical NTP hydrolase)